MRHTAGWADRPPPQHHFPFSIFPFYFIPILFFYYKITSTSTSSTYIENLSTSFKSTYGKSLHLLLPAPNLYPVKPPSYAITSSLSLKTGSNSSQFSTLSWRMIHLNFFIYYHSLLFQLLPNCYSSSIKPAYPIIFTGRNRISLQLLNILFCRILFLSAYTSIRANYKRYY